VASFVTALFMAFGHGSWSQIFVAALADMKTSLKSPFPRCRRVLFEWRHILGGRRQLRQPAAWNIEEWRYSHQAIQHCSRQA
jgi:hypothetical protein